MDKRIANNIPVDDFWYFDNCVKYNRTAIQELTGQTIYYTVELQNHAVYNDNGDVIELRIVQIARDSYRTNIGEPCEYIRKGMWNAGDTDVTWTEWVKLATTSYLDRYFSTSSIHEESQPFDLNTRTEEGIYRPSASSVAMACSNLPSDVNFHFILQTFKNTLGGSIRVQVLLGMNTSPNMVNIYTRFGSGATSTGASWSAWNKFAMVN